MSFPRYPKYKPSGVEWLGEVPEGWTVRPLKTIASGTGALFIDGDWIESKDISSAGIRYLTSGNVGEGFYKEQGQGFITNETFNELKCTEVLPGDLLISRLNVPIGRACIVPDLGTRIVTCVDNVVVRPASIFNTQFCVYLLSCKGHLENTEILGRGATMPRLSRSALGRLPFAFPPLPEQTAIAEFLDRETGKIDELVAAQRQLVALLKEKRQAVISHAVTKGLNPHAPMKPSGIEWLGDVPVHWEMKRLKYLGEAIIGLTYSPADLVSQDSGTLVLRSSNVQGGNIVFDDNVYVSSAIPAHLVTQVGDILICSRNGSRALIGKNATIDETSAGLTFGAFMTIFRSQHSDYIGCVLNSPLFEFQSGAFMTSTINQLTIGVLNNFEIPLPPATERERVVAFLQSESSKFNTLTAEAQRAIDLLQERRTALISAAVTGQIDVRRHPKN